MTSVKQLLSRPSSLGIALADPVVLVIAKPATTRSSASSTWKWSYQEIDGFGPRTVTDKRLAGIGTLVVPELGKLQRPLKLFGTAFELLQPSGHLVVCSNSERSSTQVLDNYRELPVQFGFVPIARFDLLLSSGRKRGVAIYRKAESGGSRLMHTDFIAIDALLGLFKSCFDTEMSSALWDWKYGDGRGEGVVLVSDSGTLVGHYGGITRDIEYFRAPVRAAQVGDVMVLPSERGILKRHGAFYRMMTAYSEAQVGYGTPHLLGVGFPNTRHMRLAERLGLYAGVDTMIEFRWAARPVRRPLGLLFREISQDSWRDLHPFADTMWQRMKSDFSDSIIGVRDGHYIRHRYLEHPDRRYRVWRVYSAFGARKLGLIVTKTQRDWWEILDLVARRSQLPTLVKSALSLLPPKTGLKMWVSDSHARIVDVCAPERFEPGVAIPNSAWSPGPPRESISGKWWLTGGDTDFR